MDRVINTLAIGTCRVAGPCENLTSNGFDGLEKFPHHLHYPSQILQTLQHYDGHNVIPQKLLYLMSEDSIRKSATRPGYIKSHAFEVRQRKGFTKQFDKYIIELSGLHELVHTSGMFVEYFAKRDLSEYSERLQSLGAEGLIEYVYPKDITARQVADDYFLSVMSDISKFLHNKPILWVSHFDASAPARVRESRQRCIDLVRKGAQKTGGSFFDPTNVVNSLGQHKALKENGDDLAHFSDEAMSCLAEVYRSWIYTGGHRWIQNKKSYSRLLRKPMFHLSTGLLFAVTGYYFI
ncbi:hypothetical protein [Pseudomonas umsongensis]|uniref:hypothetical protein n=1 Tax=Pseudomonas umsongensis TaxID=198618 RepID=UPI0015BB2099|nr:hypothetical protein [Pseudomonas umsongensis]NWL18629.1 hypothetical protein [Pseudomonas umsongensis]